MRFENTNACEDIFMSVRNVNPIEIISDKERIDRLRNVFPFVYRVQEFLLNVQ